MTDEQPRWRLWAGITLFLVSFASPLVLVPLVALSELPVAGKTALSGFFAFGLPEVGMVAAVAVMGKPGYDFLKEKVLSTVKGLAPDREVSPGRYRVGLVFFSLPLLYGWLGPYVSLAVSGEPTWRGPLLSDVMFLSSFFILGGDFWDKVRALFVFRVRVVHAPD